MDAQRQQLFGLMMLAEEHQKAAKAALDDLAAERGALAKERAALSQAAQGIQRVVGEAVATAVRQSLADASDVGAAADLRHLPTGD